MKGWIRYFLETVLLVVCIIGVGVAFLKATQSHVAWTALGLSPDLHGALFQALGKKVLSSLVGLAEVLAVDRFVFPYLKLREVALGRGVWEHQSSQVRGAVFLGYMLFLSILYLGFCWVV